MALVAVMLLSPSLQADLVHQWKFNGYATDSVGSAHGFLGGGAALEDGRLFLDGIDGQVLTSPIDNTLTEKTLVSWVSLADLDQPGGGSALSVQIGGGSGANGFDGIVYAERQPYQWMAGSNFWSRSVENNLGEEESVSEPGEVMMAIAYAADNSITIYRDGEIYADPFDASLGALNTYEGGVADVIFGRRHDGAGNPLYGWINEARIYDTALDLDEIQAVFTAGVDLTDSDPPPPPAAPELVHQWTFNGNARDQVGEAHGMLTGGATLEGDRLYIDGVQGSRMLTDPIGERLDAKTLMAWVSLDDVAFSSRGSALTIQNNASGDTFDAIVYGEAAPERWMAGSNGFVRTQNPQEYGWEETVEEPGEVLISIVYDSDSSITLYRDGELYGEYMKGSLQPFGPDSVVQIGPRHGGHQDVFAGFVNEARIYSGALSDVQIANIFQQGPSTDPNPPGPEPPPPTMVHQWTFDGTTDDQIGSAHGTLSGGAMLDDGRLSLDGIDGQMLTSPIDETLTEKTLMAWVSLENLDQPGGGSAISVQIGNGNGGNGFDGIVYAERQPYQWMAGSDFWRRSVENNFGDEESVTEPGEVMVAITYDSDNTITIYRDGELYAEPEDTTLGSLNTYQGGVADVIFGRRHDGAGNPLWGWINEARIYNKVLTPEEIAAVFAMGVGASGDFDGNGAYELNDIDMLTNHIIAGTGGGAFDLDDNGLVDTEDHRIWVKDVKHTWYGDANLDGQFNTGDFVQVLGVGKYETQQNASWAEGDWNGDGVFGTGDLVTALGDGGYEVGPRPDVAAVPEPAGALPLALGWILATWYRRHRIEVR